MATLELIYLLPVSGLRMLGCIVRIVNKCRINNCYCHWRIDFLPVHIVISGSFSAMDGSFYTVNIAFIQ